MTCFIKENKSAEQCADRSIANAGDMAKGVFILVKDNGGSGKERIERSREIWTSSSMTADFSIVDRKKIGQDRMV